MNETPNKFDLRIRRPFWIAAVRWEHELEFDRLGIKKTPTKSQKLTAAKLKEKYNAYCNDDFNKWSNCELDLTAFHYQTKYRNAVLRLLKEDGGILMPTDHYRGLAISFESAADVKRMADAASKAYTEQKNAEKAKASEKKAKAADRLEAKYSAAERRKKVHYCIHEDHYMMGTENYNGTVTIGQLVDLFVAEMREDFDAFDTMSVETFGKAQCAFTEWMNDSGNDDAATINKLLKGKPVTGAGEVGVEAFAKSAVAAKKACKEEFLKWEDF